MLISDLKNSSKHNQFLLFVDVSVSVRDLHHQKKLLLVLPVLDQPGKTVWLSVNHYRLGPVDCVIRLVYMVGQSGFIGLF